MQFQLSPQFMASHNISIPSNNSGFTLIEILVSIAILAIILTLGLFVSLDFYKSYAFHSEKNTIVSILQKARGQSLNNIDQTRHGVHFEPDVSNPQRVASYTIFEGSNYVQNDQNNIIVAASYGVLITSPALPFDVIFDQLSGSSSDKTIIVSNGVNPYNITVNSEGQIDWQ